MFLLFETLNDFISKWYDVTAMVNVRDGDGAIGYKGKLLAASRSPEDMAWFVSESHRHQATVMGRATADSINPNWRADGVVLRGRTTIVATRRGLYVTDPVPKFNYGGEVGIIVAGGAEVYEATQEYWTRVNLTRSPPGNPEEPADTFFMRHWLKPLVVVARGKLGTSSLAVEVWSKCRG